MKEDSTDRVPQLPSLFDAGALESRYSNPLTGSLIAKAKFEAAHITAGSNAYWRVRDADIRFVTASEVLYTVFAISDHVTLPLIVDTKTGFGNALNVQRTVRLFERFGLCVSLIANMVESAISPVLPYNTLHKFGYQRVIFPGAFVRNIARAIYDVLILAACIEGCTTRTIAGNGFTTAPPARFAIKAASKDSERMGA